MSVEPFSCFQIAQNVADSLPGLSVHSENRRISLQFNQEQALKVEDVMKTLSTQLEVYGFKKNEGGLWALKNQTLTLWSHQEEGQETITFIEGINQEKSSLWGGQFSFVSSYEPENSITL